MKRSEYHQILGCLVTAGKLNLAKKFKASAEEKRQAKWKKPNANGKGFKYSYDEQRPSGFDWRRV